MSSTYSSSLRIELIGSGDQAGAWGATTDSNFAYIFDTAIAGYQAVPITSTSQALTYVNGPSSTANLNQAVYAMLKFTGASAATSVYIPPASKQYIVWNNTSYAITIYNSTVIGNTTAAGTGITLAAADKIIVWSDGTNVYDVKAQGLTGTLAIANGGTGQTTQQAAINALTGTQTNNRVLRSDGTNVTLSQVNVSTDVTGTLAVANGGTGQITANAALNALLPTQTANRLLKSDGTNTSFAQAALTTDVTGTLPVANGGTGATTFTSAALLRGNGTSAISTASASDIVTAIGGTAVALSTNSTNAIGYGQTWQDVKASRATGTTYTNSTGRAIAVCITGSSSSNTGFYLTVDSVVVAWSGWYGLAGGTVNGAVFGIVPSGSTYSVTGWVSGSTNATWAELR
jgi:hypothetical protein